KQIGQYHKALKELSCQLATLKEKLNTNMKENNKTPGVNK
ncbi:MAG: hypothetical protein MRECE_9c001, partial [Mycoplasmataceae bacterium CE_OT135]